MLSRINFDQFTLKNGIECYVNPIPLDYTVVHVQIPRGTAHNVAPFLPGTFHLLEHVCCEKSRQHPMAHEYEELVGLAGGYENAWTASFWTTYMLSAPDNRMTELLPGLFSRVFEPIIDEQSIGSHRAIIANERLRRARWFPGSSERGWFEQTQWMKSERFSIEQVFGSDGDLKGMNADMLYQAHNNYKTPGVRVIAIGSADLQPLWRAMEQLKLVDQHLPTKFALMGWQDKRYRVQHFRDVSRYSLKLGGIIQPRPDIVTERQLQFILSYATNTTHGALYTWLRRELGWTYGLGVHSSDDRHELSWELDFPVNSLAQVGQVRREWRQRIAAALQDQQKVNLEVERLLGKSAYWDSTPQEVFDSVVSDLFDYDQIISNDQRREHIASCRDIDRLQELFAQYWSVDEVGEYCAAPE